MSSSVCRQSDRCRLIVFGRYPVPGRVKTRLIPALGAVGAADLHRRLTEQTMTLVRQAADQMDLDLCFCHDGGRAVDIVRWLDGRRMSLVCQTGGDVGRRMAAIVDQSLSLGFNKVVLVGTDIVDLRLEDLRAAFHGLERHDLVLGPSRDGGYYLVGLKRPAPVFDGMDWGGPTVCRQTLDAARRNGLTATVLAVRHDVDTVDDLPRDLSARPLLSVIVPALNEAGRIEATLKRARCDEAELIVVDGRSHDDTVARARAAGARVVVAGTGRALQQNAGAASAGGRMLLFLHADTHLPKHYVRHIFDLLLDRSVVLGAFRFATDMRHWGMRLIEKTVQIRSKLFHLPYGDQALFMRRSDFDAIGGFPLVPIAEDLLLVRRMAQHGKIRIAPAAAVTSARRWQRAGVWKTTLINYRIAGGLLMGMDPARLAPLYRIDAPAQRCNDTMMALSAREVHK